MYISNRYNTKPFRMDDEEESPKEDKPSPGTKVLAKNLKNFFLRKDQYICGEWLMIKAQEMLLPNFFCLIAINLVRKSSFTLTVRAVSLPAGW